jgi:hypothetical protein
LATGSQGRNRSVLKPEIKKGGAGLLLSGSHAFIPFGLIISAEADRLQAQPILDQSKNKHRAVGRFLVYQPAAEPKPLANLRIFLMALGAA